MGKLFPCIVSFLLVGLVSDLAASQPQVFYTDITSGPNSGGEGNDGAYLSLFGKGFGAERGSSKVTIGGGEVATYKAWGDSKVSVQVGRNAKSGKIVLTTAEGTAEAADAFTVRPGNFYFIAANASDSRGSANNINKPYRTPNYVRSLLRPGDFMIVRGGNYLLNDGSHNISFGSWWRIDESGSAASPVTLMGYSGEDVVLTMNAYVSLVGTHSQKTVSNIVIANFKVALNHCQPGNVVSLGAPRLNDPSCNGVAKATDVRVVNLDIDGHDVGGMCSGWGDNIIEVGYADRVKILGVSIHNTSPAQANEGSHLIYLSATQAGSEIGWNHVHDIPRSRAVIQIHTDNVGGKCYGSKKLTDISIHDNRLHDIAGQAILLGGGTGDISVYNNVIYRTPLPDSHQYEDIIALRGDGGRLNATLYNNVVYANPNHAAKGWVLGLGSVTGDGCPEQISLRNNVFYVTDPQDIYASWERWCANGDATIKSENNIWYGSKEGMPSFHANGDRSVNPLFDDPEAGSFNRKKSK